MNSVYNDTYLHSIPLLKDVDSEAIAKLGASSTIRYFSRGDVLFYEKEKKNEVFYLVSGSLKLYKVDRFDNEVFLYSLFGNSLVFDLASFSNISKTQCYANAEFLEDSEIIEFNGDVFREIFYADVSLSQKMLFESFSAIVQMQKVISRDVVYDGTAKVAHMLANDLQNFNNLKKHEIAYMLHIQPETLSRILKKLTRNGTIEIIKNSVVVLNMNELKKIYE
ncbi:MAG: Crp/Fnr family transcriptional regulator [Sulfurospirillaceae bacterium]|nr:Crp/Fnr family transcriptional regulator [Sulfurospirillaceae bacterium]MDD3462325.1 Crp/Fnr family transcriptional regulator [Sulfurospirillaceae bacterium]